MLPPLSRLSLLSDDAVNGPTSMSTATSPITIQLLVRVLAVVCLIDVRRREHRFVAGASRRELTNDSLGTFLHRAGGLVVFVSRRILFPHQKRALTLTEINTLLNRHENGGTGVVFRKWRKRIFPPPVFGDEDELAEAEREEQAEAEAAAREAQQGSGATEEAIGRRNSWTFTSKPQPEGLRSCLRVHSELAAPTSATDSTTTPSSSASSEAPSADTTSTDADESSNIPTPKPAKRVRIVEPELDELETLRELWSTPEMFALHGSNGIGGFRRTRDFYSKSQGGSAVVKRPTSGASSTTAATTAESGSLIPATKADDEEGVPVVAESSSRVKPIQRLQRDSLATSSAAGSSSTRTSSLSPAPTNRRHRTLSPAYAGTSSSGSMVRSGSPAFIVGSQSSAAKASPSRRRALSPGVAGSHHHALRNASPSAAAGQGEGPRWVKARGTHSAATRSGKDSSSGAESSSAAAEADSSEHETTDDDGESGDEHVSPHSRVATAASSATRAETVDGSATPPPSSFSSVLHHLTSLDALGAALESTRTSITEQHAEKEVPTAESPAVSILSGGESPQESPTPAPHPTARRAPSSAPTVAVTPSFPAPPAADQFLAPLPPLSDEAPPSPISPSPHKSTFSTAEANLVPTPSEKINGHDFSSPSSAASLPSTAPSSTASTTASSTAVSPSPCIAAQDRRLSLRVQQALRDKRQKRHGSPASIGSRGSGETISPPPPVPLSA
ncbi:hypothetical protein JCM10908_002902 [Rhodotorula pacifica]|uniref:uncharacterized protein n=1 Tax=Rhodotorula pacifica TaxID=1495444 RepID=UPI003182A242